jgi:hypothetical protein
MFVFDNKALTSGGTTQEARSESYRGTQRDRTTKSVADADMHRRSFGMVETIGRMESLRTGRETAGPSTALRSGRDHNSVGWKWTQERSDDGC